jgi:hypothetical protein
MTLCRKRTKKNVRKDVWKFNLLVLRHSLNPGPYLVLRNRNEHSRAGLDTEGLDPKGGNLSESRFLYSGSGSAMKQMGPRTLAWHRSQELTWISKGSTPGAATFLNPYPYMLDPPIRNETNGASNNAWHSSQELTWISKGSTPGAATLLIHIPIFWIRIRNETNGQSWASIIINLIDHSTTSVSDLLLEPINRQAGPKPLF